MRIETAYQTKNRCFLAAKPAQHIGILVHATGANNKNLKRYVDAPEIVGINQYGNHWNNAQADKCMHAFIGLDKDGEVIAIRTLPYEYACWGCGKGAKGSYNYDPTAHIQFEICQGSDTDADYYARAIAATEEFCAQLCQAFGFTPANIVSHNEAARRGYASDHSDPESWMKHFGDDMNQFRARVASRLAAGMDNIETEEKVMKYKVTGTRLALRAQPTTAAEVLLRMETGTVIEGVPHDAEWVRITYAGKTGYSMVKFLQVIEPVQAVPGPAPDTGLSDKEKLDRVWEWYLSEAAKS